MSEQQLYPVTAQARRDALIDERQYRAMYRYSIQQRDTFWAELGNRIDWIKPFAQVRDCSFAEADFHITWYQGGLLNVAANCLDRHLPNMGDSTALIWEPDNPDESHRLFSYRELHEEVCRFANGLRQLGVARADVVTIYLPRIPEAIVAMLACARIGAVHCVADSGSTAQQLSAQIEDSNSRWLVTADHSISGGHQKRLKQTADAAIAKVRQFQVEHVVVVRRSGEAVAWQQNRDIWYTQLVQAQPADCEPAIMGAEDPLFVLYPAGSGDEPGALVYSCGGYLVYVAVTHQYVFDHQPTDIYWCSADLARLSGHSYVLYGPLANGATSVMYEGQPDYPDTRRWSQIIDKYKVNIFCPSAAELCRLKAHGGEAVTGADLSSIRLLGTAGEPIDADTWRWFYTHFGGGRCPLVDTWLRPETGGILIAPLPGATALKPGSVTLPFFGVEPELLDDQGNIVAGEGCGSLVIRHSWPGQARSISAQPDRLYQSCFSKFPGYYFSGERARRDEDGYYWISAPVGAVSQETDPLLGVVADRAK